MTDTVAAWVAFVIYLVGLGAAFGVRTVRHLRQTGSTGFKGISGRPGSLAWWGGVLFVVALVVGLAATVLAVLDVDRGPTVPALSTIGVAVAVLGVAVTLLAQAAMGRSWRIGVGETETTALVEHGLFRWVRNPVFTGLCTVALGVALLVPSALAALSLVTLVLAVQIQVGVTEEPYLRRVHGPAYGRYEARTGRFLPRLRAGSGRVLPARTGPDEDQ